MSLSTIQGHFKTMILKLLERWTVWHWQANTDINRGVRTNKHMNNETGRSWEWHWHKQWKQTNLVFKAKGQLSLTQSPTENMLSQQVWGTLHANASTDKWISHWVTPKPATVQLHVEFYWLPTVLAQFSFHIITGVKCQRSNFWVLHLPLKEEAQGMNRHRLLLWWLQQTLGLLNNT